MSMDDGQGDAWVKLQKPSGTSLRFSYIFLFLARIHSVLLFFAQYRFVSFVVGYCHHLRK